jgi:hypothetical protein
MCPNKLPPKDGNAQPDRDPLEELNRRLRVVRDRVRGVILGTVKGELTPRKLRYAFGAREVCSGSPTCNSSCRRIRRGTLRWPLVAERRALQLQWTRSTVHLP